MSKQKDRDLVALADFLDSRFRLPFGIRVGWDGILGLIPGIGDLVTNLLSLYIIGRAASLNAPPSVLWRMGTNVLVENIVDLIPGVGSVFDFFWRANLRNVQLLQLYSTQPRKVTFWSRVWVGLTVFLIIGLMVSTIVGMILILGWMIRELDGVFQSGRF